MERTMSLAPENPEVLYDLAVVRLAAGNKEASIEALKKSLMLNPKLKKQAIGDNDLKSLRNEKEFQELDTLAYKLENGLLRLVESLESKRDRGEWIDTLMVKESNAVYGNE